MRLYKGQIGPVMDEKAYALALRELAARPGLCSAGSHERISEDKVREALAILTDERLIKTVQIAAHLSQADEIFAEYWFLRQLGFSD